MGDLIKNYIATNLEYLVKEDGTSMDEFGFQFDLKRGVVSQYCRGISLPKLETIQRICLHYKLSIDDFVNRELATLEETKKLDYVNEPPPGYGIIDLKYVELLEKSLGDKDKLIKSYEVLLKKDKE